MCKRLLVLVPGQRQRLGIEVFERFFERIVDLCQEAGLVWSKELYFDATRVRADADTDSLVPRSISRLRPTSPKCSPLIRRSRRSRKALPTVHRYQTEYCPSPCMSARAQRPRGRRARPTGTCWSSGASTPRDRRIGDTGAPVTSGSARPIPTPVRCGRPARPAWATTTTMLSTAASAAPFWRPW